MIPVKQLCRALVAVLSAAAIASCGQKPAPAAPAPASARGGEVVGALPSQVVSGHVAAFKPPTSAGVRKVRDSAGALPSSTAAGESAVYAPGARP